MTDKRKGKKRRIRLTAACVLICMGLLLGGYLYVNSLAYKTCYAEAGVEVLPQDFLKNEDEKAVFTEKSQPIDIHIPGEYTVYVKSGLFTHKCKLVIQDTVAPKAESNEVILEYGDCCEAAEFVKNIEDATNVTVEFITTPDFEKGGEQTVSVILSDIAGNTTTLESKLLIAPVLKELTWEAGSGYPTAEDFTLAGSVKELLSTELDTTKPSKQNVTLKVDGEIYNSVLNVVDTVAPVVQVQNVFGFTNLPVPAEKFVVSVEDVTEVTVEYEQEPDISVPGVAKVTLVFTDEGNNRTMAEAELTLEEDTEPPVIAGARDIVYIMGTTISYRKNIILKDNCEEGLQLNVDSSQVNTEVEGVYPVTYTATDYAGNSTSVTVNVTVKPMVYDVNEVYGYADAVLASIFTEGMSEYDKLWAIYSYVKGNIGYINHSDKGDWVKAAYEGLVEKSGDCYVYACTTKVLLDRAGITNMDIAKIPAKTSHYWNLVDIGEGWYHLDTTPRKDHPTIFYWTDEQLMEYSSKHNNSHNYDHDAYPKVN